ncbi:MAG: adenosylcobinamide-phosphate synthase CbiB [Pseudomonadota bacterium]
MSTPTLLILALLLDAAMGEPRWLWARVPHPAILMGRIVGYLDAQLNHPPAQRMMGVMAVLILIAGAAITGWVLSHLGAIVTTICAAILLAHKSLIQHVRAVADGLRLSPAAGRQAVSMIVSRDVSNAPPGAVTRAAIESLSENFSDGVIAPAFWFLIAGLPGIAVYKVVNTADSMIGYLTPKHAAFGWAAARTDDLLNLVPARLTAAFIAVVGGVIQAWPQIVADARLHKSPNAGWPEAAMARALNVALAGPRSYHGSVQDLAWVNGSGDRNASPARIDAAITVIWRAWGLAVICIALAGGVIWIF